MALDIKSGARRNLTDAGAGSDGHPSFSPDGEALFFERVDAARAAILALDVSSGLKSRVTPADQSWRRPAAISAHIAVAERHHGDAPSARAELMVIRRSAERQAWRIGTRGLDVRQPAVHVGADKVRVAYTALLDADPGQPRRYDILVGRLQQVDFDGHGEAEAS